jgi:large subunit ribosomal protein L24
MVAHARKKLKAMRRAESKHSKLLIHRDDKVQIIAGDERGKVGKVLKVLPARQRVVVEGANVVFRHVRKSPKYPQGGRIEREAPLHISNVLLFCEKCGKGGRVRIEMDGETKARVCKKCDSRVGG